LILKKPILRRAGASLVGLLFSCANLGAYEVPLSATALHEAWTLGQRNDKATADFFLPYVQDSSGKSGDGTQIAEIEIFTPFAQVVDKSRQNPSGYPEQQAQDDYHKRGDTVVLSVLLMLPAAFPKAGATSDSGAAPAAQSSADAKANEAIRPENFWQNFRFVVKQGEKVIASRAVHNNPVYSSATKDTPSVLDGAKILLEYDAKDIASEPLTIEVVSPDAKTFPVSFDMKTLR
jgi:hypothetical protein